MPKSAPEHHKGAGVGPGLLQRQAGHQSALATNHGPAASAAATLFPDWPRDRWRLHVQPQDRHVPAADVPARAPARAAQLVREHRHPNGRSVHGEGPQVQVEGGRAGERHWDRVRSDRFFLTFVGTM